MEYHDVTPKLLKNIFRMTSYGPCFICEAFTINFVSVCKLWISKKEGYFMSDFDLSEWDITSLEKF